MKKIISIFVLKLKLEELGYDCKKLESQKIEIDTLFN